MKEKIDTIFVMLKIGCYTEQEAKDKLLDLYNVSKKELDEAKQIAYNKGCYDGYKDCKNLSNATVYSVYVTKK